MISMDDARARVARGAAHLDTVKPGWHERIDIWTLSLSSCTLCVMGQLGAVEYGAREMRNFMDATNAVGWRTATDCREHGVGADCDDDFPLLQDAWIEAIVARLYPDHVAAPVAPSEAVSA